jgi:hypothetical protein
MSEYEEHDCTDSSAEAARVGLPYMQRFMRDGRLTLGMHVHTNRPDGNTYCEGGDASCALFGVQLIEALKAWSS